MARPGRIKWKESRVVEGHGCMVGGGKAAAVRPPQRVYEGMEGCRSLPALPRHARNFPQKQPAPTCHHPPISNATIVLQAEVVRRQRRARRESVNVGNVCRPR